MLGYPSRNFVSNEVWLVVVTYLQNGNTFFWYSGGVTSYTFGMKPNGTLQALNPVFFFLCIILVQYCLTVSTFHCILRCGFSSPAFSDSSFLLKRNVAVFPGFVRIKMPFDW